MNDCVCVCLHTCIQRTAFIVDVQLLYVVLSRLLLLVGLTAIKSVSA